MSTQVSSFGSLYEQRPRSIPFPPTRDGGAFADDERRSDAESFRSPQSEAVRSRPPQSSGPPIPDRLTGPSRRRVWDARRR